MTTKSLHDLKMEDTKKNKPNMLTDSDYFLRDKEDENGVNTLDITGATNNSAEEALTNKLALLEAKIAQMTADAVAVQAVRDTVAKTPVKQDKEGATK